MTRHQSVRYTVLTGSAVCFSATLIFATGVHAESLADALRAAYHFNPRIEVERARLRAQDEDVARANSGFRPTVNGNAEVGLLRTDTNPGSLSDGRSNPVGYGMTVSQPVFSGFRTVNAAKEAESAVMAGRESLRAVEHGVLFDTVIAYADVLRDLAIVRLREKNLGWLAKELAGTRERLASMEATRTDLAQVETRRAGAISALDEARAQLKSSRATFVRIVGREPSDLRDVAGYEARLPASLDEALSQAAANNPSIAASRFRADSARYSVEKTTGELLPSVQLDASYLRRFDGSPVLDRQEVVSMTGRVNVPLYAAGDVDARVRQSKHQHFARVQEIQQTSQEVDAAVKTAWSRHQAARSQVEADKAQVRFAREAMKGIKEEFVVGQRTSIEVLNTEQEAVNAEIQLEITRRNMVVSGYSLLASIGRMSLANLTDDAPNYDPAENLDHVRRRWSGVVVSPDVNRPRETTGSIIPSSQTPWTTTTKPTR